MFLSKHNIIANHNNTPLPFHARTKNNSATLLPLDDDNHTNPTIDLSSANESLQAASSLWSYSSSSESDSEEKESSSHNRLEGEQDLISCRSHKEGILCKEKKASPMEEGPLLRNFLLENHEDSCRNTSAVAERATQPPIIEVRTSKTCHQNCKPKRKHRRHNFALSAESFETRILSELYHPERTRRRARNLALTAQDFEVIVLQQI